MEHSSDEQLKALSVCHVEQVAALQQQMDQAVAEQKTADARNQELESKVEALQGMLDEQSKSLPASHNGQIQALQKEMEEVKAEKSNNKLKSLCTLVC